MKILVIIFSVIDIDGIIKNEESLLTGDAGRSSAIMNKPGDNEGNADPGCDGEHGGGNVVDIRIFARFPDQP